MKERGKLLPETVIILAVLVTLRSVSSINAFQFVKVVRQALKTNMINPQII
jgi:hypothetical protein